MAKKKPPRLQNRRTPQWLFDLLDDRFGPFALDAFASDGNALCPTYYTKKQNGLEQPWVDLTFANPPFKIIGEVLRKAIAEGEINRRSIIIGPVGCCQQWMHDWAIYGTIYVPTRRINFDTPTGKPTRRADRDTMIYAFGCEYRNPHWHRGYFRMRTLQVRNK